MHDNRLSSGLARVASIPFRLFGRQGTHPPRKALILQPCCLTEVLLTTPLLAALAEAYPQARFDWGVHEHARPAIAGNERITELVDTSRAGMPGGTRQDMNHLIEWLRQEKYDTCFIPNESSVLAFVAWRAGIQQRIGLSAGGRGFSHTVAVTPPTDARNLAAIYLTLAHALGVEADAPVEFYPGDADRTVATQMLVDEVGWLGEEPLVLLHPGGGVNPVNTNTDKRWPAERFVLLANHLIRRHKARVVLVGGREDEAVARTIVGMMPVPVANLAGRITLGELGAMCEMADLYVGNDTGPTHVAAAVGCATLAIFGPTNPTRSAPYAPKGPLVVVRGEGGIPFSWKRTAVLDEVFAAADRLLQGEEGDEAADAVDEAAAQDAAATTGETSPADEEIL